MLVPHNEVWHTMAELKSILNYIVIDSYYKFKAELLKEFNILAKKASVCFLYEFSFLQQYAFPAVEPLFIDF